MKKTRFTETQIVAILKEADAGLKVMEIVVAGEGCINSLFLYPRRSTFSRR